MIKKIKQWLVGEELHTKAEDTEKLYNQTIQAWQGELADLERAIAGNGTKSAKRLSGNSSGS